MQAVSAPSPTTSGLIEPKPAPVAAPACFHCHDPLPAAPVVFSGKKFCCEGCRTVFEILDANGLCTFYDLSDAPGLSQKSRKEAGAWAFLDDPEVREKILQFSDGQTARATFSLPAMHCASCIWLLEQLWRLDAGISSSRVDFLKKTVAVQFDEQKTSLRRVAALLSALGYPPELSLGDLGAAARKTDRSIFYKIGVAGFAFGNIMLLSFPEYLGIGRAAADGHFFKIFGWLNLLLALPVLLYSARDYFVSAFVGLRNRHLNLDLPLALGAAMLFGRSAWEVATGTGAGYFDSFAGLIFFLNIGRWFQQRTFERLSFERDYRAYFPISARVKKPGGPEESVAVARLAPGDVIAVRNGELIPADGILLRGEGRIDYSFVTGEAEPVLKKAGDKIYAGGKQVGAAVEVTLTRNVSQSYLTQLWNDSSFKTGQKSHASQLADRAGRYFTGLILAISGAAFLYWAPRSMPTAVNAFTAVLMVACPCAVALSIPFTMGTVLRVLGRRGFYLKNAQVAEAFGNLTATVFDKTGTITEALAGGDGGFLSSLGFEERSILKSLTRHSSHPVSRRVFEMLGEVPLLPVAGFEEITGQGIRGEIGGQPVSFGKAAGKPGTAFSIGDRLVGSFSTGNTYRPGLAAVASFFKKRGKTFLLSGDNDREAAALLQFFEKREDLRFDQSPADKLSFLKKLAEKGEKALMLGDGLNDAGALRAATVGIAVTEDTNHFAPACDAILDARAFEKLPAFIRLAEGGVWLVGKAYVVAFCYNIVGLSYAVTGTLSPVVAAILMPVSSLTVILFGTLGVRWKARQLGLNN